MSAHSLVPSQCHLMPRKVQYLSCALSWLICMSQEESDFIGVLVTFCHSNASKNGRCLQRTVCTVFWMAPRMSGFLEFYSQHWLIYIWRVIVFFQEAVVSETGLLPSAFSCICLKGGSTGNILLSWHPRFWDKEWGPCKMLGGCPKSDPPQWKLWCCWHWSGAYVRCEFKAKQSVSMFPKCTWHWWTDETPHVVDFLRLLG